MLDSTFFLYRKHFVLFVGIVAVPYLILLAFHLVSRSVPRARPGPAGLWALFSALVYLIALAAAQAGTVVAVSDVHLKRPVTIGSALGSIKGRLFQAHIDHGCGVDRSGRAIARHLLLRAIDGFPGVCAVGWICMMCNKYNRRLGDYVAGTVVVHDKTMDAVTSSWSSPGNETAATAQFSTVSADKLALTLSEPSL